MSAWTCRQFAGKAAQKIVPPRPRIPCWKGLRADSEEKREPVSDIDAGVVDSLKALDPERPIREADILVGVIMGQLPTLVLGLSRRVVGDRSTRTRRKTDPSCPRCH